MERYKDSVRIARLLAKKVMRELSQKESDELSFLLENTGIDPEKIVRNLSYEVDSDEKEIGKQVWQTIEAKMVTEDNQSTKVKQNEKVKQGKYKFNRVAVRYAAVIAFLLALSVPGYYIFKKTTYYEPVISMLENTTVLELPSGKQITLPEAADISDLLHSAAIAEIIGNAEYTDILKVKVSSGSTHTLYLPDSTKVTLYPRSELSFPAVFGPNERLVALTGEGYFQVTRDESREFKVNLGEDSVVVLGTKFNIRAYIDENIIETSLVSGKVAVNNTVIAPDQMAVIGKEVPGKAGKIIEIRDIDASVYSDRASGMFVFENKSMDQIMREFSLWYGIEYSFSEDSLKNKMFRFRLPRTNSFNYLIKLMEETGEVKFEFEGDVVKVLPGQL